MWTEPNRPYQDLPPLPPSSDVETRAVLKKTISASRALSNLRGATKRLPNPALLINLIPLLEAQASSEIENIVTTNDELFRAAHNATAVLTPQVKEALQYRTALHVGYKLVQQGRPITANVAIEICSTIQNRPVRIRDTPGTYIGNPVTKERIYTPPEGKDVILDHLTRWETFVNTHDDLDPLVVMALSHYQFEAIHPFFDGNGRTGRILNLLQLIHSGLIEFPILYLSGHILRHKDQYYRLLNNVTQRAEWEPWILFMLDGIESTAEWTHGLIEKTASLQESFEEKLRSAYPKWPVASLTRLLFTQPYLRIDDVVEAGLAGRQTVSKWLNAFTENDFIIKEKIGRSHIFINRDLLELLFNEPLPS